ARTPSSPQPLQPIRQQYLNRNKSSLLLQLQGMFAEYERAKELERSRRGKRYRAQSGAVSDLSRAPFGYRYVTREAGGGAAKSVIAWNAAPNVRFALCRGGH